MLCLSLLMTSVATKPMQVQSETDNGRYVMPGWNNKELHRWEKQACVKKKGKNGLAECGRRL